MGLEEALILLHLLVDDAYRIVTFGGRVRQRGPDPKLSDVEVLTMEIFGEQQGRHKKRFSQFAGDASCKQEDACGLEQGLDDEAEPVIAEGEALVLQHPGVGALDRPAPLAQTGSVRL